jgi:outer membrane biosynthesis protein TonB
MKLSIIVIILLLGQGVFVQAKESDIDAQIERIQNASESERYLLVNELKKQIAQMNALQQARAISRYQENSLKIEQNVNVANQIMIDEQEKQIQEQQIIIPAVKKIDPIVPSTIPDIEVKNTPTTKIEEVQERVPEQEEVQQPENDYSPEAEEQIPQEQYTQEAESEEVFTPQQTNENPSSSPSTQSRPSGRF